MKILFLAANPQSTSRLNLGEEVREIEEGLRRSKLSDRFQLVQRWAVRPRDLRRALLEENPDIVHFSGHGTGKAGWVLVDNAGQPKPATGQALAGLFTRFPQIKCVLLNACYAEVQAQAIVRQIDYVIGMRDTILDDAAIAFTTGFYDGLGYGRTIDDAFELGRNAILFELSSFSDTTRKMIPVDLAQGESSASLPEDQKPILLKKAAYVTPNISSQPQPNVTAVTKVNPVAKYCERVREYLADRILTPIEKFQLATLAKQLGISEIEANNLLQAELEKIEQAKENYQTVLRQTIKEGYYPFNSTIQQQFKNLQTSLELIDSEVAEISSNIFQEQAEIQFQKGKSHYEQKEYQSAIADFTEAIRLNPEYALAYYNRGISYKNQREYQKAIADYTEAIRFKPEDADAYIYRGNSYHAQGEYQKAIADFTEAIRLNPEYALAYYNRGISYKNQREYQKAIADYTEAIRLNPEYALAYYNRGISYKNQREYQKAIADYTEAIRLNPEYADAYIYRGNSYSDQGEYQKAIADYTEAIRLNPEYAIAYYNRGNSYKNLGEYQKAIADYTEAIRFKPEDADAYIYRGNSYHAQGEYQKAIADYTEAIRLNPKYADAYIYRGNSYRNLGEYQKAIADYTEAIRLNPEYADAYINRGISYSDQGEYEKAIADYTEAIRLNPEYADAYYNRGNSYQNLKDQDKAIKSFQQAGDLYQQQGKTEDYQDALNRIKRLS